MPHEDKDAHDCGHADCEHRGKRWHAHSEDVDASVLGAFLSHSESSWLDNPNATPWVADRLESRVTPFGIKVGEIGGVRIFRRQAR